MRRLPGSFSRATSARWSTTEKARNAPTTWMPLSPYANTAHRSAHKFAGEYADYSDHATELSRNHMWLRTGSACGSRVMCTHVSKQQLHMLSSGVTRRYATGKNRALTVVVKGGGGVVNGVFNGSLAGHPRLHRKAQDRQHCQPRVADLHPAQAVIVITSSMYVPSGRWLTHCQSMKPHDQPRALPAIAQGICAQPTAIKTKASLLLC